ASCRRGWRCISSVETYNILTTETPRTQRKANSLNHQGTKEPASLQQFLVPPWCPSCLGGKAFNFSVSLRFKVLVFAEFFQTDTRDLAVHDRQRFDRLDGRVDVFLLRFMREHDDVG